MMKRMLLVILTVASVASSLEARDRCRPKRDCKPKCEKECVIRCADKPAKEICGVLCRPVKVKRVEYECQPDRCVKRMVPCPMVKKTRCVPQPDIQEVVWEKKIVCKKQPDRQEVYWESVPDKCCEEMVPCPPKKIVKECIEYIPVNLCTDDNQSASNNVAAEESDEEAAN